MTNAERCRCGTDWTHENGGRHCTHCDRGCPDKSCKRCDQYKRVTSQDIS